MEEKSIRKKKRVTKLSILFSRTEGTVSKFYLTTKGETPSVYISDSDIGVMSEFNY